MSWESVAGGSVAAIGAAILVVRDYRKSKVVDDSSAQSGIAMLVENLQEDNRDVRERLATCEQRYEELLKLVTSLRDSAGRPPPTTP